MKVLYISPKTFSPSPAGNRTPVSRVTGGDTHHYTTEEFVNCFVALKEGHN